MAALNPSTGEIVIRKFLTDRNDLARKLADLPRPLMVAVESSRHSPAICRWLQAMGAQVRLVNAAKLAKHTEGKAAKTDANDAEAMLRLMRLDELPECYLASEELGPLSACMARVFWALLGELEAHLALVNSEVKSQVAAHPVARQLCTLPEIGCIERFADPKNLHSYAGVVPRVSQSGDSRRTGSLVRECNRHLRRAATTAAQGASRCRADNDAKRTYNRVKRRCGSNSAKIAAGRKVLTEVMFIWRELGPEAA